MNKTNNAKLSCDWKRDSTQDTYLQAIENRTKSAAQQEVNRKLTVSDKRPDNQTLTAAGTDQVSDYLPFKNHHFRFVIEHVGAHAHKKKTKKSGPESL